MTESVKFQVLKTFSLFRLIIMFNYDHQGGVERVRQVTFLRGARHSAYGPSQPFEFQKQSFYATSKGPLDVNKWLNVLCHYLANGIKEILVSGHHCGKYLRDVLDSHGMHRPPIFIIADGGKLKRLVGKAVYRYPLIRNCRCRLDSDRSCSQKSCTELRAVATFLHLNKWLMWVAKACRRLKNYLDNPMHSERV